MGKSYKKRLKQERAKIKLKVSHKTQLPKGQNLTDTSAFKVKKIVIKDQVTANRDPNELLFRNKSNLKELISRLKHHNVGVKLEALEGLKSLLSKFSGEIFDAHFSDILEAVVKLLLDSSSDVRRPANKMLAVLLSQIPTWKLAPFYSSLNAYLMCCLTHIESGIREDGLRFLDSLLAFSPSLCSSYAKDLLSVALDLISTRGTGESGHRTLSVDLENRRTSLVWRMNVLVRIRSLMDSALGNLRKDEPRSLSVRELKFEGPSFNNIPLYCSYPMDFDEYEKNLRKDSVNEDLNLQEIGDSLIPLLLDMFIEIRPSKLSDDESRTNISKETGVLLHLISDIILLILDLEEITFSKPTVAVKHGRNIVNVLVESHFPYAIALSANVGGKKNRREKTKFDEEMTLLSELSLNLSLVKLVLSLASEDVIIVIPFLKTLFRNLSTMPHTEISLFSSCLKKFIQRGDIPEYFVNKIIENEFDGHHFRAQFFHLLSEIALNPEFTRFQSNAKYVEWLSKLPQRLTSSKVPKVVIHTICRIAVRNFPSFTESLNGLIEVILDNIPKLSSDDESQSPTIGVQVATLLYWVNDWDDDMINCLVVALRKNYWEPDVASLIRDIILTKFPSTNPAKFKSPRRKKVERCVE